MKVFITVFLFSMFLLGNNFISAQTYTFNEGSCYQNVEMTPSGTLNGKTRFLGSQFGLQISVEWSGTQWEAEAGTFGVDYANSTPSDPPIDGTWIDVGPCNPATGPTFSPPLPVELVDFNVSYIGDNTVLIAWRTESELNNDYFTIERSIDGRNWEETQHVSGAGNSNTSLNYSVNDRNSHMGRSYYRLKQTDFDGHFEYSQIKNINIENLGNKITEIYPNPTLSQITINGNKSELSEITMYNSLGKMVMGQAKQILTNETSVVIDLSNLTEGIYYLKTKTTVHKVVKQ